MNFQNQIHKLMLIAIEESQKALLAGEVPIGAVVFHNDKIISQAHNLTESQKDPTAHSEILALKKAGAKLNNWRLNECILCVTLEPCTMCMGAIRNARVGTVIYGAEDPDRGASGSLYDLSQDSRLGPVPRVIKGILKSECESILKEFFKTKRAKN
ncbi:MAG: nucleoside deaminase [bacterium]|nr:nucleoside deaminase [bacterium]